MLTIGFDHLDAEEAESLLRALRRDLLASTDVPQVDLKEEPAPPGAKSGGGLVTELAVQVTGSAVGAIVAFVGAWVGQRRRSCTLVYTLKNGAQVQIPSIGLDKIGDGLPPELLQLLEQEQR